MSWDNIPLEMREYRQWICWRLTDKAPLKTTDGRLASVIDPRDWSSFSDAASAAYSNACGLGFVFTGSDPYCGIDCDTQEISEQACDYFKSYAERSPSGRGVHVIVKGKVGGGRRTKNIECYDRERYFTMTGDANGQPIEPRQPELDVLWAALGAGRVSHNSRELDRPSINSDAEIFEQAGRSEKFRALWAGGWRECGYPSQSEADMEFCKIVGYWSRNYAQCLRLFISSGLYRAPPAKSSSYPSRTVHAALACIYAKYPILQNLDW